MRWNQGRAEIDKLIADGELQRLPPNREHADQLFAQARKPASPQARKDLASAELPAPELSSGGTFPCPL
jgi:hypothetical protein